MIDTTLMQSHTRSTQPLKIYSAIIVWTFLYVYLKSRVCSALTHDLMLYQIEWWYQACMKIIISYVYMFYT